MTTSSASITFTTRSTLTGPESPNETSRNDLSAAARASVSNRTVGPWTPTIAASSLRAAEDGRGDRGEILLALAYGLSPPLLSHLLDLSREDTRVGDRPRGEPMKWPGSKRCPAEGEHHLAGRRCMRNARPADLRDALHRRRAPREVNRDRLMLAREPKGSRSRPLPRPACEAPVAPAHGDRDDRRPCSRAARASPRGDSAHSAPARRSDRSRASRAGATRCWH